VAQDGSKRSKHMVVVEQFQFLGGRRNEASGENRGWSKGSEPETEPAPASESAANDSGPPGPTESDIPF
jgi:single-stranded DNA-binding protein